MPLRQFNYKLMSKFTNLDNYMHKVADQSGNNGRMRAQSLNEFLNLLYPDNRNKTKERLLPVKDV